MYEEHSILRLVDLGIKQTCQLCKIKDKEAGCSYSVASCSFTQELLPLESSGHDSGAEQKVDNLTFKAKVKFISCMVLSSSYERREPS